MLSQRGGVSLFSMLVLLTIRADGLVFNNAEIVPTETYLHSAEMDTKGEWSMS